MRSSRRAKIQKKPYIHPRINKKKYKKRSKESWGWNDDNVSGHYLSNINEALRENKAQRAEGKGSWKVVPKDSCEVYKNRRKRESNRRKQKVTEESSFDSESQMDVDKKDTKKPRKKNLKKKVPSKKPKIQKTRFRKRPRRSSLSSYTNTTTSVSTTHSTMSEMDND